MVARVQIVNGMAGAMIISAIVVCYLLLRDLIFGMWSFHMRLYWLVYRLNNQILGPMDSPGPISKAGCGATSRDYVFDGPEL